MADCGLRRDYDARVSTYVLMRILESAPGRYDGGMRLLTFGSIDRAYDRLATHVSEGARVLDIGCGTGALALRAARRGARVKGIDVSAGMLEIGAQRVGEAGFSDSIELEEMGVALLDGEEGGSYDAVMSGLCLSELSDDEIVFTLTQIRRILRPGGWLYASTIDRSWRARMLVVHVAEGLGFIPRGTHDPDLFIPPAALDAAAEPVGLVRTRRIGESPDFLKTLRARSIRLRRARSTAVAYSVLYRKGAAGEGAA